MPAYHQMGHVSQNLLGEIEGYQGAIISPVNDAEADVARLVRTYGTPDFEFVFDPQMYYPNRSDRGQLASWSYFPKDFDTADVSSAAWWDDVCERVYEAAARVATRALCSPATIAKARFTSDYYEAMRANADRLVMLAGARGPRVLQTVIARLTDLQAPELVLETASVVSHTKAAGIYLVLLSDVRPREELRDVDQLTGAMKLIRLLEDAGLPVLVGFSSSDVVLWKSAGASSCATGKFANLRRFTHSRFTDPEDGRNSPAYWLEEGLLAFCRQSDLDRLRPLGMLTRGANPFGEEILTQLASDPKRAWLRLGWRQYMHWFADVECRLADGTVSARTLIRDAEANWEMLERGDVFMEEPSNDGRWLRPWLRATTEFNR